ncbi:non-ribosomal peptide synthetase [Micromonospora sp. DR5-3]|uniref:non-ribosomal peptide synthetase n=1 Tax=unclassified Micromonospora TaxID=2617518 RepID=UPI0011DB47FC|nr:MULTISPECIES: non-ribosomal peptide synthetase [unclassified Micromonospora]MCW3816657.1 non-ribosomal peptide synthetase [Micromonospora sp. DR5-3]TYC23001.1 amino acid adenylation domain-containing protein [Micromonospora sp. MP36]
MTDILTASAASGEALPWPDATLADLITAQAARTPDAVAVRQWDDRLSYAELVDRAAGVAAALRERGVGRADRVGVCGTRTPDLVVTVLGVLLAGGCYVPLEPGGPRERLREIARDAGVRVVVGDAAAAQFGDEPDVETVGLPGPAPLAPCPARPGDPAYVLFTSGSTGRPKGVLTTHRNAVEFVTGITALTGADAGVRSLGIASLGFDAATMDLFVPLLLGGAVQLLGADDRADPVRLARFIAAHEVTWGFITPTVLALLDPAEVPSWRVVLCGGEAVPAELVARWAPGRRFLNGYGPTETTVLAVSGDLTAADADPVPIGLPLPNHRAYVVDTELRPMPPGETGELLIGGPGLADGYLNRPGLTAERFVPDPFGDRPGERLYRTGDLVRQAPDGRIVYLGRADRQVKVRGQRIELGEVEAVLAGHPGVDGVAVEAVPGPAGTELVAFLIPADAPDDGALRAYARPRLTTAMLPARTVRLAALPVSPTTGKLDRPALRALATSLPDTPVDDADGGDPVEATVRRLWARLLGAPPRPDSDFLAAGGNSIAAMRLVAALRAELGRQVDTRDLFTGRTFAALVDRVRAAAPADGDGFTTGNPPTLAPPQRRLWFMDQLAPSSAPYNIAVAHRLRGPLDTAALGAALRAVVERHDVLRWRIPQTGGVPYAVREEPTDVAVPVVDLTGAADAEAELATMLAAGAGHAFDLATGPPWQGTVYRVGADEHVLALTMHHAVFDGWSEALLYDDLATAYARAVVGEPPTLPALPATYADYAVWRAERDRRRGAADLAWWTEHLAGAPTVLDLPRDRPRPAVQTYAGAEAAVVLAEDADRAVRELAGRRGTTVAAVLLAGFGELLRRLTGADDHVLGAIVADRRLAAFDDVIGFFIDTVPVRVRSGGASFAELVDRCAAELHEVTTHPGAPLERIVEALGVGRDTSRAPLVQVLFNVLNFVPPRLALAGLAVEPVPVPKPGSPFDITVYVVERAGRAGVEVVHNPDLFDGDRIDALLADLAALVGALAADPDAPADRVAAELPRPAVRVAALGAMTVAAAEPARAPLPAGPDALTETEELIAGIWREVLGKDRVGVAENFFDIGGHSMALAAVHARLTEATGRSLTMLDLFRHPTVRALAASLDGAVDRPELARAALRAAARRGRARRTPPRRPHQ